MSAGASPPGRPVVVDAALAVKWVLPEELSGRAQGLYEEAVRGGRPVVGPPMLPVEVVNVIHQRRRKNDITAAEADAALDLFLRLRVEPLDPPELHRQAAAFAVAHRLKHVYDAHYAVLARLLETELWTADRAVLKSLGPAAPLVRWIGDFPSG